MKTPRWLQTSGPPTPFFLSIGFSHNRNVRMETQMMARKIWQAEFAHIWFGAPVEPPPKEARKRPAPPKAKTAVPKAGKPRPLGIVEAHRKALREKRVLKPQP